MSVSSRNRLTNSSDWGQGRTENTSDPAADRARLHNTYAEPATRVPTKQRVSSSSTHTGARCLTPLVPASEPGRPGNLEPRATGHRKPCSGAGRLAGRSYKALHLCITDGCATGCIDTPFDMRAVACMVSWSAAGFLTVRGRPAPQNRAFRSGDSVRRHRAALQLHLSPLHTAR